MRNILEYEDYRYLNENYDIIEDALHKDKELNDLKKKQNEKFTIIRRIFNRKK